MNILSIFCKKKIIHINNVCDLKKRDYDSFNYNRKFLITTPNSERIIVNNVAKFCRNNMLKFSTFHNLISGKSKQSKDGWKCQKIN